MADNPINLLRKVLAETENGNRVRTLTRMEIKQMVDQVDQPQQPITLDEYKDKYPEEFNRSSR